MVSIEHDDEFCVKLDCLSHEKLAFTAAGNMNARAGIALVFAQRRRKSGVSSTL